MPQSEAQILHFGGNMTSQPECAQTWRPSNNVCCQ